MFQINIIEEYILYIDIKLLALPWVHWIYFYDEDLQSFWLLYHNPIHRRLY